SRSRPEPSSRTSCVHRRSSCPPVCALADGPTPSALSLTCVVRCEGPSLASSREPVARGAMHRVCQLSPRLGEDARTLGHHARAIVAESRSRAEDSRSLATEFETLALGSRVASDVSRSRVRLDRPSSKEYMRRPNPSQSLVAVDGRCRDEIDDLRKGEPRSVSKTESRGSSGVPSTLHPLDRPREGTATPADTAARGLEVCARDPVRLAGKEKWPPAENSARPDARYARSEGNTPARGRIRSLEGSGQPLGKPRLPPSPHRRRRRPPLLPQIGEPLPRLEIEVVVAQHPGTQRERGLPADLPPHDLRQPPGVVPLSGPDPRIPGRVLRLEARASDHYPSQRLSSPPVAGWAVSLLTGRAHELGVASDYLGRRAHGDFDRPA